MQVTSTNMSSAFVCVCVYSIFGITIIISEMGVKILVVEYCRFMDSLFGRGLFYVFAGTLMVTDNPWYMAMLSGITIAIGFIYMILYVIPSARPSRARSASPQRA
jgi:hypothetical protein